MCERRSLQSRHWHLLGRFLFNNLSGKGCGFLWHLFLWNRGRSGRNNCLLDMTVGRDFVARDTETMEIRLVISWHFNGCWSVVRVEVENSWWCWSCCLRKKPIAVATTEKGREMKQRNPIYLPHLANRTKWRYYYFLLSIEWMTEADIIKSQYNFSLIIRLLSLHYFFITIQ